MREYVDATASYIASMLGFMFAHIHWADINSCIMGIGSLVLLCSRLVIDVPKAYRSIMEKEKEKNGK